ncbi:MAG: DoxX family protein, partial [Bacteroidota bacterium]
MKKLLFNGTENTITTDFTLALLRLFTGLSMAFAHGLRKIPPSEGFIEHTGEMGFPLPEAFAWSAGLAEFAGGILLAIGLMTRPAAFFVAVTMFVAGFVNHGGDPFGIGEKAYLYFAISILYMIIGSGRYSMDSVMRRKLN